MPIYPVHFAHGVCDEFLRYLFSAFPLPDPELAEQARKLLERPSSLDIPLVQGAFVSLSEAFARGELVQTLADQDILHRHGVSIEKEVEWPRGGKSLYYRDPAGNSVELVTPGV
jgi:hypothetical protein